MTTGATLPTKGLRPWRLTVDQYLRMGETGILSDQDRVFLWKGQLVEKMTRARPHVVTELRLRHALFRVVPAGWYFEQEAPMRLALRNDSLPEPDFKVVRGRMEDYDKMPTARDIPLVIEVADSSLPHDRRKVKVYGAESIPFYWIANVPDRRIEAYSEPTGAAAQPGYGVCAVYRAGMEVPVVLDGVEVGRIDVAEIFPEGGRGDTRGKIDHGASQL